MRRATVFLMIIAMLISVTGCRNDKNPSSGSVTFYYIRAEYEYSSDSNVIVAEQRSLSGSTEDLSYLLTLYMLGPTTENLVSPFPVQTRIMDIKEVSSDISVTLSGMDTLLTDSEFTLASGCLALTLFGISECNEVTVYSGERNITLTKDNFLLNDQVAQSYEITEDTP